MKLPLAAWLIAIGYSAPASAQVTQRISISTNGIQGNGNSSPAQLNCVASADGRFVAFSSQATDLVPGDVNGFQDVFVRDRHLGTTRLVSADAQGSQGNSGSYAATVSADGRYIAFASHASNLVPGDTNSASDVFVRDLVQGTIERVSIDSGGVQANAACDSVSISTDGRFIAFHSWASNLLPGDFNSKADIFVHDRATGVTECVSISPAGTTGNGDSYNPAVSNDGRFVAFMSLAQDLVFIPGGPANTWDVFVRDRIAGTTSIISLGSGGLLGNGPSHQASISADGQRIAFASGASNLVPNDTNAVWDVFVHDRIAGTTERASVDSAELQGNSSCVAPHLSADGRYVAFYSFASNLVPADLNHRYDVFVRDLSGGTTERVSLSTDGVEGNDDSFNPSLSANGRYVAFNSLSTNLEQDDSNGAFDTFLRDRNATGFSSLCEPGVDGAASCPCSNPPGGPGRGCDNSSSTGGASLRAAGIAYLSMDSLVLTTADERPTALSIVMQGSGVVPGGVVYGQGVRCVGGTFIRRLFVKNAVNGSITAPDFGAGDPSVSARSAAKGDVIQPGQSRWYLVYYRDPNVLGGCPATSNFNATQTGQVTWSP